MDRTQDVNRRIILHLKIAMVMQGLSPRAWFISSGPGRAVGDHQCLSFVKAIGVLLCGQGHGRLEVETKTANKTTTTFIRTYGTDQEDSYVRCASSGYVCLPCQAALSSKAACDASQQQGAAICGTLWCPGDNNCITTRKFARGVLSAACCSTLGI